MLAAVYHGPRDLRVEEVAAPVITPEEVLLKVASASICGTDLRILSGGHRMYPAGTVRIPGHEAAGIVSQIGAEVKGIQPGQRMFVAPNMGCGHCRQCIRGNNNLCANYEAIGITMDGAFAEYVRLPKAAVTQGNLIPIEGQVDPAVAALMEPFACVLRGQNAVQIQPEDIVLVMGAGPIGLMHLKLALLRGAGRVIVSEPNPSRLDRAKAAGATDAINPASEDLAKAVQVLSHGQGADAILVAAPAHQAQEAALTLAAIGGRINFFAGLPKDHPTINFDSNLVHYKELIVTATTACSTADCRQAADLVNSGRIDLSDLISARLPLREAQAAFTQAEDQKSLKIVLEP
jgi:L-iditol 2-dehydrogenase